MDFDFNKNEVMKVNLKMTWKSLGLLLINCSSYCSSSKYFYSFEREVVDLSCILCIKYSLNKNTHPKYGIILKQDMTSERMEIWPMLQWTSGHVHACVCQLTSKIINRNNECPLNILSNCPPALKKCFVLEVK